VAVNLAVSPGTPRIIRWGYEWLPTVADSELERARRLVDLLTAVGTGAEELTNDAALEVKWLHMGLAPAYSRLYGRIPLIDTSYPASVWVNRAYQQATDILTFLEAERPDADGEPPADRAETSSSAEIREKRKLVDEMLASAPTAFVLMPFDPEFDWLYELLLDVGIERGIRIERADNIFAAGVVVDQIRARIASADVVIAVCTGRNPNVFFDLGLADQVHRPVLIGEHSKDLPFDVQHYRAQFYGGDQTANNRDTLAERVSQAVRETLTEGRKGSAAEARSARVHLSADILKSGNSSRLVITNDGGVDMVDVEWSIPPDTQGWNFLINAVPNPIPRLEPGEHVTVPVAFTMPTTPNVSMLLKAKTSQGAAYRRSQLLTIFG
jgi:hypothetical protein